MNVDIEKLRQLAQGGQNALELGKAAEHLVCADLIMQGFPAFLTDQGMAYDVIASAGEKLIRIQVKASCFPKNWNMHGASSRMAYAFNVRARGKQQNGKRLDETHCDMVAFVALDISTIAYRPIKGSPRAQYLAAPQFLFEGRKFSRSMPSMNDFPFLKALGDLDA